MGDLAKDINSAFESEQQKALLNILYTSNYIASLQNDFFKTFGLSPQQYNILRILRGAKEPLKVQTIKSRMIDRSPNVTRLTDKLIDKGLIERFNCETDRRVVHIQITQKGLELLTNIPSAKNKLITKDLTTEEAKTLNSLLDKLRP
ncbi:MarR family winged helix-turn-helix transcriptional regulator [Aurantibacter sp.]|uniref:MarR family winged helix-turn-helix transcriptional regulator n=1 Tax=Aurantibacter sp. TaxID=2807103 RepID=UPI0035C83DD4